MNTRNSKFITPINNNNLKYIPWIIAIALFMEIMDANIINTAIPKIALSFKESPLVLQLAITSYLLGLTIFIPISGWIADRYGANNIFTSGIIIFTIGSILCSISFNIVTLSLARFIQGSGGAIMVPVGRLVLLRSYPKSEFIKAINYMSIPAILGFAMGPIIGGFLVHYLGWRSIFYLNIPIGIAGIFFSSKYLYSQECPPQERFDFIGLVIFSLGLSIFSIALELLAVLKHTYQLSLSGLIISFCIFTLYLYYAAQIEKPIFDLKLFKVSSFKKSIIGNIICRTSMGGIPFMLPIMFQLCMGMKPITSGLAILPLAIGSLGMKFASKRLITRYGFRKLLTYNSILMSLITSQLALINSNKQILILIVTLFIYGAVTSLQLTAMNALNYVDILPKDTSKATSMAAVVQQLAWSVGVTISSLFLTLWTSYFGETNQLSIYSFHYTFIFLGFFCLLSTIIFMKLDIENTEYF